MSKKWIVAIAIYLGLLTVCLVLLYAVPSVRGILEKTYIAEFGTLDVKDEVSAFIVRDEHVYVAKKSSDINRLIEEGELVKAASAVVELTPREGDESDAEDGSFDDIVKEIGGALKETEKGYTSESGYVSYHVDGAEAELTTSRMAELTKEDYQALTGRKAKQTPKNKCKRGEPVFKIVRNGKWYLVFYTTKENGVRYREGSYITMDVEGEPIRVSVYSVEELGEDTRVMLECKSFFNGFLETRNMTTTVTLASAEGLILQMGSLVENDGKTGVFIKNKLGEHVFKPVSIIAIDGERCVAEPDIFLDADGNFVETIGTYDEVIAEPSDEDKASIGIKIEENTDDKGDEKTKENSKENSKEKTEEKTEDTKQDGNQG